VQHAIGIDGHQQNLFMKKIYVLVVLSCVTALFANAQFDVGQKVLGGILGSR
jgi:hypothetical protein